MRIYLDGFLAETGTADYQKPGGNPDQCAGMSHGRVLWSMIAGSNDREGMKYAKTLILHRRLR